MDAYTDLMMIDTDDENPPNPVQAALSGSENRFVANSGRDVVRLAMFMRGDATINSLTVTTRNVDSIRMVFFNDERLSEELVSSPFQMSRIVRKPVFGDFYQVQQKLGCTATEICLRLEVSL